MNRYSHIYLIGIGGIGMSAIARYFRHRGLDVSGYDKNRSPITDALEKEGIRVHYDSDISAIPPSPDSTLVIYTPAVPGDMPELSYAIEHGYKTIKRSEALGEAAKGKKCLAVSGTHGKTTTSTMLAHILTSSGEGCTAFLGGISKNYGTNLLLSPNDVIVAEADEFDRSFLRLFPESAVITSVDADHLDIYSDIEDLRNTFVRFAMQTSGHLVIKKGIEDRFIRAGVKACIHTYGPGGDYFASDIRTDTDGKMHFTLNTPEGVFTGFTAGVPGTVNIENATAAAAMALIHGVTPEAVKTATASFRGVARRFDIHLNLPGHTYVDDYAHHPAEIAATVASIRQTWPGRKILGIFQPHLYSRTRDFYKEFAASLSMLDSLILLPIYPAREKPLPGVSSQMILDLVTLKDKTLLDRQELTGELRRRETDIVVTFGAGDIDRLVTPIENLLRDKYA